MRATRSCGSIGPLESTAPLQRMCAALMDVPRLLVSIKRALQTVSRSLRLRTGDAKTAVLKTTSIADLPGIEAHPPEAGNECVPDFPWNGAGS